MRLKYLDLMERNERRRLLAAFMPAWLRLLRTRRRYRRAFPDCYVAMEADVSLEAVLEEGVSINRAIIGAHVRVGACTTVNDGCILGGDGEIQIGRFCSLAPDVTLWSENHRIDTGTTFPLNQYLTGQRSPKEVAPAPIRIGHDVWVGRRALVLAGAVVPSGKYPPYTIIGGVPARTLRQRPAAACANDLAEWWNAPLEEIFRDRMPGLMDPLP